MARKALSATNFECAVHEAERLFKLRVFQPKSYDTRLSNNTKDPQSGQYIESRNPGLHTNLHRSINNKSPSEKPIKETQKYVTKINMK